MTTSPKAHMLEQGQLNMKLFDQFSIVWAGKAVGVQCRSPLLQSKLAQVIDAFLRVRVLKVFSNIIC